MIFGAKIQTIRNYCIKHLIVRLANVKIERDSAHMSLSWHYFRVGGCQIDFDLHHHFLRRGEAILLENWGQECQV